MFPMISQKRSAANALNGMRVAKWPVLLLVLAMGLPVISAQSCAAQDGAYDTDETFRLTDDTHLTSLPGEMDTSRDEQASLGDGAVRGVGSTGYYRKIVVLIVIFLIFWSFFRK